MASAGDLPLVPPPPGYVVNLSHPPRNGETAGFWVPGVGMVLSTSFLATRLYTKVYLSRNAGLDDVCLVLAWVLSLAIQLLIIYLRAKSLLAVHVWDLSRNNLNYVTNMTTASSIAYCPLLGLAKFSILLLYLKLGPIRWFHVAVYITMFIVIGANFALIFAFIFACTPVKRGWDITITEGSCINRAALYIATAVLNMITDILLLLLPIPIVVRLQMPRIQKLGLILIFAIGSMTFITSCIRLVVLLPLLTSTDSTWAVSTPSIWVTVEANLIIICVTLPSMRRFLRHVAPFLIGEAVRRPSPNDPSTNGSQLQTIGSKTTRVPSGGYDRMAEACNDSEGAVSLKGGEIAAVRSADSWPLEAGPVAKGTIEEPA